jgi:hypothetical protein
MIPMKARRTMREITHRETTGSSLVGPVMASVREVSSQMKMSTRRMEVGTPMATATSVLRVDKMGGWWEDREFSRAIAMAVMKAVRSPARTRPMRVRESRAGSIGWLG